MERTSHIAAQAHPEDRHGIRAWPSGDGGLLNLFLHADFPDLRLHLRFVLPACALRRKLARKYVSISI